MADGFQVIAVGDDIIMTSALGGSGCLNPLSPSTGCYRLSVSKSLAPLGERIFNLDPLPESRLPNNRHEYARIITLPNGQLNLMGMFLVAPQDKTPTLAQGLQTLPIPWDQTWLKNGPGSCGVGRKSPDWGMKNNQCLASCGGLGGKAAFADRCENHKMRSVGDAYDVPFCCPP